MTWTPGIKPEGDRNPWISNNPLQKTAASSDSSKAEKSHTTLNLSTLITQSRAEAQTILDEAGSSARNSIVDSIGEGVAKGADQSKKTTTTTQNESPKEVKPSRFENFRNAFGNVFKVGGTLVFGTLGVALIPVGFVAAPFVSAAVLAKKSTEKDTKSWDDAVAKTREYLANQFADNYIEGAERSDADVIAGASSIIPSLAFLIAGSIFQTIK